MPAHARCSSGAEVVLPALEVADIFRRHLDDYRQLHALTEGQHDVARAIIACRTAALGGHLDLCTDCGFETPAYNSCRNRHCPKCQALLVRNPWHPEFAGRVAFAAASKRRRRGEGARNERPPRRVCQRLRRPRLTTVTGEMSLTSPYWMPVGS